MASVLDTTAGLRRRRIPRRRPPHVGAARPEKPPDHLPPGGRSRSVARLRRHLRAAAYLALVSYHQSDDAVAWARSGCRVAPGHKGALDVYVPLVDWGARFEAIRAPLRLRVDLQTVDRDVATAPRRGPVARRPAGPRRGARRARHLPHAADRPDRRRRAALGLLVAFAIRSRVPRLRWTAPTRDPHARSASASRWSSLIPPRGEISNPQYYAHGPDIPRALEAVEAAQRTTGVLDQELDAQLVGLARLVVDPGRRRSLGRPAGDHGRLRPAQQHGRARRARAARQRRPGVLRRRPDRPRLAARDEPRQARRAQRQAVRVRHRQPRLRLPQRASSPREGAIVLTRSGRLRADGTPTAGSSTRSRACGSRATTTRSSAARPTPSATATTARPNPAEAGRVPRAGCSR